MQQSKFVYTTLFVVFGVAIYCSTASLANAAGFDSPYRNRVPENNGFSTRPSVRCEEETREAAASNAVTSNASQHRRLCPLTLEWQRWSQPYNQDSSRCRELNGNFVCVTPEAAERLRW